MLGHAIRESEELITTVAVGSGSDLADQRVGDVSVEERTGVSVMAIRRREEWVLVPDDDAVFRPEDVLVVRGPGEGVDQLRELARR